jgi:hypothetical protein
MGARLGAALSLAGLTLQIVLVALVATMLPALSGGSGFGAVVGVIVFFGFAVLLIYIPSMVIFLAAALTVRGSYSPVTGIAFAASGLIHLVVSILMFSSESTQDIQAYATPIIVAAVGAAMIAYGLKRIMRRR